MKPLLAWTSHHYAFPLPPRHRFPIGKFEPIVARLLAEGVLDRRELHFSTPAPVAWLESAHDPVYVRRALDGGLSSSEIRRLGLPWSGALAERARTAVFGTVSAATAALVHGVAGSLAGGSHHAHHDRAEGFCLFNDLAIAIAVLRGGGTIARPFVVDLDVHQGNGTAAIFANDPAVFTYSIHGASNHPLEKARGSLDVALADGSGDAAVLEVLERTLPEALDSHRPDIVFYQAGVDALASDRLGRLAMSHEGLAARDELVFGWCEARGLPVAVTLGGGYAEPIEESIAAHVQVWRAARASRERRPGVHDVGTSHHAVDRLRNALDP